MLALLIGLLLQDPAPLSPGEALYTVRCKGCHEPGLPGIPDPQTLKAFAPEAVIRSLERGNMKPMGANLTADEKRLIAEFVTGKPVGR